MTPAEVNETITIDTPVETPVDYTKMSPLKRRIAKKKEQNKNKGLGAKLIGEAEGIAAIARAVTHQFHTMHTTIKLKLIPVYAYLEKAEREEDIKAIDEQVFLYNNAYIKMSEFTTSMNNTIKKMKKSNKKSAGIVDLANSISILSEVAEEVTATQKALAATLDECESAMYEACAAEVDPDEVATTLNEAEAIDTDIIPEDKTISAIDEALTEQFDLTADTDTPPTTV